MPKKNFIDLQLNWGTTKTDSQQCQRTVVIVLNILDWKAWMCFGTALNSNKDHRIWLQKVESIYNLDKFVD